MRKRKEKATLLNVARNIPANYTILFFKKIEEKRLWAKQANII